MNEMEIVKKYINSKCVDFTEGEKKYLFNKISNAIKRVPSSDYNAFEMSFDEKKVRRKYIETVNFKSGKSITFGFDYA